MFEKTQIKKFFLLLDFHLLWIIFHVLRCVKQKEVFIAQGVKEYIKHHEGDDFRAFIIIEIFTCNKLFHLLLLLFTEKKEKIFLFLRLANCAREMKNLVKLR